MSRRNVKGSQPYRSFFTVQRKACDSPAAVASRQPDWFGGNVTSDQLFALAGSGGRASPGFRYCMVPFFWKSTAPNFTGRLSTTRYWMTLCSCHLLGWIAVHGVPGATPRVARIAFLKSPSASLPSTNALQASRSMSDFLSPTVRSGPPVAGGAASAADTVPIDTNNANSRRFPFIIAATPGRQADPQPARPKDREAVVRA